MDKHTAAGMRDRDNVSSVYVEAAAGGSTYAMGEARAAVATAWRMRMIGAEYGRVNARRMLARAGAYRREALRCKELERHGIVLGWQDVDWHADNDPRAGWQSYYDAAVKGGRGEIRSNDDNGRA